MDITREEIIKLADNLLINLADQEVEMLSKEFKEISSSMDLINNISGIDSAPVMHAVPFTDVLELREDEAKNTITREEVIANCADSLDMEVRVPKVVENGEY